MPVPTVSQLRRPAATLALLLLAACSSSLDGESDPNATASAVVGDVGGEVTSSGPLTGPGPGESDAVQSTPAPTPTPAPTASPPPTPAPQADGFSATVQACQSISGSSCNGEYGTMAAGVGTFTALVTFTAANAGDTINVVLTGPSGTFASGPYTLGGGGDGYYYSNFSVPNLGPGTYTLTASRNGSEVATTTFTKDG